MRGWKGAYERARFIVGGVGLFFTVQCFSGRLAAVSRAEAGRDFEGDRVVEAVAGRRAEVSLAEERRRGGLGRAFGRKRHCLFGRQSRDGGGVRDRLQGG